MSVEKAEKLRAQGLTYTAIAERLGVHTSTIRRWCDPDYAEANRKASRERKRERREPCLDCGKPKSYDRPDNERCKRCQHEHDYAERNDRLREMWQAGVPTAEIARSLGIAETAVLSWVNVARQRNGEALSLRRRRDRELWPDIERLWNADTPGDEIAARLGTTRENVLVMVQTMRKRGIEMVGRGGSGCPRRWDADAIAELQAMWNGGASLREIADREDLSVGGAGSLISKLRFDGHDFERRYKAAA